MKFNKAYLDGCRKDVHDLTRIHLGYWSEPRYKILKKFCANEKNILSVGCGPKEPIITGASHAVDIVPDSGRLLQLAGWKGEFQVASVIELPFPDKSFNIVVCSEVIEHLPNMQDVIDAIKEVNRVGKKFIITTPNSDAIKPEIQNPTHKQFFKLDIIKELVHQYLKVPCKIYTNDHHIYIEGGVE